MPVRPRSQGKLNAGQVVEAVLQMMEQGPQPMRNMRPTKASHQSEYESYGQGKNRTSQVDAHNDASPKMKDELDRRRSMSKPTTPSVMLASKGVYYDPRCRACQKLKQAAETKKRNAKKSSEKKRKTDKKSRVTKKKRGVKSSFRLVKMRTNRGSQYYSMCNDKGTSPDIASLNNKVDDESELIYFSSRNSKAASSSRGALTNPSQNVSNSEVISQNPDTSANSLSSYNSNMSLDHEPMVSK